MTHKKGHVDILQDPISIAAEMLQSQLEAVERQLGGPKRNPLRDALPAGMTLKRLKELLGDA